MHLLAYWRIDNYPLDTGGGAGFADLVNRAYGPTPADAVLTWQTAPPPNAVACNNNSHAP